MKTITRKVNLYSYGELNEGAKQKAREFYYDMRDPEIFTEMVLDELEDIFPYSSLNIQYSLNYCQGDGLNIYGKLDMQDILRRYNFTEKEKRTLLLYARWTGTEEIVLPENHRYNYCYVKYIDIADAIICYLGGAIRDLNEKLIDKMENYIIDDIQALCNKYEQLGYNYFYEIDETEIVDYYRDNNIWFTQDGSIYY